MLNADFLVLEVNGIPFQTNNFTAPQPVECSHDTPDKSHAELLTDSYGVVHNQPVLVSLNSKYSPILISPEQRFEIVGKVLS